MPADRTTVWCNDVQWRAALLPGCGQRRAILCPGCVILVHRPRFITTGWLYVLFINAVRELFVHFWHVLLRSRQPASLHDLQQGRRMRELRGGVHRVERRVPGAHSCRAVRDCYWKRHFGGVGCSHRRDADFIHRVPSVPRLHRGRNLRAGAGTHCAVAWRSVRPAVYGVGRSSV